MQVFGLQAGGRFGALIGHRRAQAYAVIFRQKLPFRVLSSILGRTQKHRRGGEPSTASKRGNGAARSRHARIASAEKRCQAGA
jgi:hypothetical protein